MTNRISDAGIDELKRSEGVRYQVYDDHGGRTVSSYGEVSGFPTIGIGHRIYPSEQGKFAPFLKGGRKMSDAQVKELFRYDVQRFEKPLNERIFAPITQSMFDALVSLAYNTGANSRSVKKAINHINLGEYQKAAEAVFNGPKTSDGKYLSGLAKRREREYQLFLKDGLPKPSSSVGKKLLIVSGITAFVGLMTGLYVYFDDEDGYEGEL